MKYDELYARNSRPDFWKTEWAKDTCNCGSFALNLTTWFAPYLCESEIDDMDDVNAYQYGCSERESIMEELLLEGCDREDVMEIIAKKDWEFILMTCPWLVPVNREEIQPGDRAIAYRLMLENVEPLEFDADIHTDFHFRAYINGGWWEKNGAGPIIYCGTYADESPWHYHSLVYDGAVRYAKFVEV